MDKYIIRSLKIVSGEWGFDKQSFIVLNSNLFDGNYSTLFDGKNKHIFHNI